MALDDPAMILYTSGTTGFPKGALLSHGNVTWNCVNVLVDYDVTSNDVALMISPMFHAASLTMGVLPALLKGATRRAGAPVRPGPRPAADRAVPGHQHQRCAHHLSADLRAPGLGDHGHQLAAEAHLRRIRRPDAGDQRLRGTRSGLLRWLRNDRDRARRHQSAAAHVRAKAGSAGLPHFFTDVRIADPAGDVVLAAGEVGEIQIQGPNVIAGYWNRPDASAESFADGDWFRSGDMGYVDQDGYLFISDRLKDMIISGGENIYPAEIEQLILQLEAVGSVAVVGVPDEKWGEIPVAMIELRDGYHLDEDAIRQHLLGRVARYKIPKTVIYVDELPRTASGKIRKGDLRVQAVHSSPTGAAHSDGAR